MLEKVRLTRVSRINVWVYKHSNLVQTHEFTVAYFLSRFCLDFALFKLNFT